MAGGRPREDNSTRATIYDVLETYFGEWWSAELLALRIHRKLDTVRQEIYRASKTDPRLQRRTLHGNLQVMLPDRSYLGGSE